MEREKIFAETHRITILVSGIGFARHMADTEENGIPMKIVYQAIPEKLHAFLRPFWRFFKWLPHAGTRHYCPLCQSSLKDFLHMNTPGSPGQPMCPICGSFERHRLMWLYLKRERVLERRNLSVLHFAPIWDFQYRMRRLRHVQYRSADIDSTRYKVMCRRDICALEDSDDTYDLVICNHVFEHVADDRTGMRELFRVIRPGGFAFLTVPMLDNEETLEDPRLPPEIRAREYLGDNHMRLYGTRDFQRRLEEVGFSVQPLRTNALHSSEEILRFGLSPTEVAYRAEVGKANS